ncbi:helix-turn-helix domain-containing protein (plasmid) [Escherichia coli]|nr:helix-turn-helix domain-containing protein [Escherichia coli]
MPAFEWVHVQLHQQKGMISLSPPTICNSAGTGATEIAHQLSIARSTVYKILEDERAS